MCLPAAACKRPPASLATRAAKASVEIKGASVWRSSRGSSPYDEDRSIHGAGAATTRGCRAPDIVGDDLRYRGGALAASLDLIGNRRQCPGAGRPFVLVATPQAEAELKYSILIYGNPALTERVPPETRRALLDGHRALQASLAGRGGFASVQLMPTTSAVTLRTAAPAERPIATDGPFADTKEQFIGFYVAEFSSLEDAIATAQAIATPDVTLEIRPISWLGGVLDAL